LMGRDAAASIAHACYDDGRWMTRVNTIQTPQPSPDRDPWEHPELRDLTARAASRSVPRCAR
jgi:hypothetical protein